MTTMNISMPVVPRLATLAERAAPPKLPISVHIDTEILHPDAARRKANAWLLLYAGHLLRADAPELILDQELIWRYDVILTSPRGGDVGKVGQIRVRATTGEVLAELSLGDEFADNADKLIASLKPDSSSFNEVTKLDSINAEKVVYADALVAD